MLLLLLLLMRHGASNCALLQPASRFRRIPQAKSAPITAEGVEALVTCRALAHPTRAAPVESADPAQTTVGQISLKGILALGSAGIDVAAAAAGAPTPRRRGDCCDQQQGHQGDH